MAVENEHWRIWEAALENLVQMQPRFVAASLKDGSLERVLDRKVRAYLRAVSQVSKKFPDADYEQVSEIALDAILEQNPDWESEKPLTEKERDLLDEFVDQKIYEASERAEREQAEREQAGGGIM